MRTSDLIRELCEVIGTHGDLPVFLFDQAERHPIEVICAMHRTGNAVFLQAWTGKWIRKPAAHPEAPTPSTQDEPNKKCICNPYAEHSTETAPNCPIHGIRARGGVYESTKEDS